MALTAASIVDENDKYDGIKFEFSVHTHFLITREKERDTRFDVKYGMDAF